jgi:predicted DNA-binding transcriptional regulator YafY
MSAGKNPYHRYQIINECFTNRQKRYWTKKELINKLEEYDFIVSERTINFDLECMRHDERLKFFAPIEFSRRERAYYYADPDYSINTIQLNDEQRRAFFSVIHLLEPYKNFKIVHEFKGAIEKILRVVDVLTKETKTSAPVIEFEKAPYHVGIDYLDVIQSAIENKQVLCITYQKFHDDIASEHVFHPYLLKESKGLWYVLGHSDARNNIINLALDRIDTVREVNDVTYKTNHTIKANQYFKHTIGITHAQGKVEEIVLWFAPKMSPYIKTQPVHASQQVIKDDKNGLTTSMQLVINYELVSLLLSYCPDVRVIKPLQLRNKLNELLEKALTVNAEK